jgi:hypothetical protein
LRHGGAFVLGDVAEAERQASLRAEALRAHLVGADAGRDGQDAAIDRRSYDGSREVDVTGREENVGLLSE